MKNIKKKLVYILCVYGGVSLLALVLVAFIMLFQGVTRAPSLRFWLTLWFWLTTGPIVGMVIYNVSTSVWMFHFGLLVGIISPAIKPSLLMKVISVLCWSVWLYSGYFMGTMSV